MKITLHDRETGRDFLVGQVIEALQPVASSVLELRFAGRLVATASCPVMTIRGR